MSIGIVASFIAGSIAATFLELYACQCSLIPSMCPGGSLGIFDHVCL